MKLRFLPSLTATTLKKCFHADGRNAAACCATLLTLTFAPSLEAGTVIWDGGGVGATDLGTGTNWDTEAVPNVAIPDTAQWNNTVTGPLSLVYSNAVFAGTAGNPGINLDLTAAQVSPLNIDTGANTQSFRMNGLTIAAGAGAFSFGNGADTFAITLGGAAGTHTWTNNSSAAAVVESDVVFGLGGGGAHTLALGGTGNFTFNNSLNLTGLTIAKSGAGTATINGTTNVISGFQVNAGIIDLSKDVALGGAAIISGAGGTINSTGGGKILLNVASGDLGVANGGTLTINSVIANGTVGSIDFWNTANGTGVVVLTGTNTFDGTTNFQSGIVSVGTIGNSGVAGNLGQNGTINIGATTSASTLRYTGTGETNNRVLNLSGTTGGATIEQAGSGLLKFTSNLTATGAGAKTLTLQGSTAGTGEISGNIVNSSAATNVAKAGTGTWTLSGANTYTGTTLVSGGVLNHNGSLGLTGTAAGVVTLGVSGGGNATLNLPAASAIKLNNANMLVGAGITNSTGQGFVNQSGGVISGVNQFQLGAGASGSSYGYLKMSDAASSLTMGELDLGSFNGGSVGVIDMSAGTITATAWIVPARGAGSTGILNMTGGTLNYNGPVGQFSANWNGTAGSTTAINIANSTLNAPLANINLMQTGAAGKLGAINLLAGGLLQANGIAPGSATGNSLVNFHGGTLKANAANATYTTGNLTGVYVYSGGGTFHNNGVNVTIPAALRAPAASGVSTVPVTNGGSGYLGAPALTFTGGDGFGATGYTVVTGGAVTGIVITNPGTGYTTAPTAVITGGGGTGATVGAATLAANTSGGMAFQGAGITTLSGTSTYTGATSVTAGTLNLSGTLGSGGGTAITSSAAFTQEASGNIDGTSSLTINAGTANLAGTNLYTGATSVTGGTLTVSGTGSLDFSSGITVNGPGAKIVTTSSSPIAPAVTLTNGTLDGTGSLANVSVGNGTGGVVANGNGGFGVLNIDTLTFNGAATVNLNLNSTAAGITTTNLTTNVAGTVTINAANPSWTTGTTYNLISYSGAIGGGGFAKFTKGTITGLGARQIATLTNAGSNVRLAITGDTPFWTGAQNGDWTTNAIAGSKNWKLLTAGTITDFLTNDAVLFSDAATGTTAVSISTASVSTSSIAFTNSTAKTYSISSPGGFGIASGSISKTGNGVVSLNTANTYAGGTTVGDGTLNINNASAIGTGTFVLNGGSFDNTSGGAVTLSTNNPQTWNTSAITFGGTQSLNFGNGAITVTADPTITTNGTGTLTLGGSMSAGTYGLTKNGTGALTLGGANPYSGFTYFNNGRLNVNGPSAIGTGTLAIEGGSVLDNTSGSPVTLTTNNSQLWNSDFTFAGTRDLFTGTGQVTLGGTGARTVTISAGNFGTGPVSSFAQNLVKAGNGSLLLTGGNSTLDGTLEIQAGIVGTGGDFTANGLSGAGILENGTANTKWSFWNINTDQTSPTTIRDGFGGGLLGIVKRGTATWTLTSNANNATSNLTVDSGKLILNGTGNYGAGNPGGAVATNLTATVGNTAAANGVLEINGASVNYNTMSNADGQVYRSTLSIGTNATGAGAVRMTAGSLTSYRQLAIGSTGGAYGGYTQTGGAANVGGFLAIGLGNASGSFNQTGGSFTITGPITNAAGGGSNGVMLIGGTAVFNQNTTGDNGTWIGESGVGRLTVSGTAALNIAATNNGLQLGRNASGSGNVNLLGGTITTPRVYKGAGTGTFNFNGGTLKPNVATATFLEGLNSAYVHAGGALIDTNGFDITVAQPLLAPANSGVGATGLTVSGSGYIDTPVVVITGDGTGATATAQIDGSGNLTGITVTNPGVNYTAPPTFSLLGGGIGNTGSIGGTATLVTLTGGGLTKTGTGKLTLSGANTYTGDTVVDAGTLAVNGAALADTGKLVINGGKVEPTGTEVVNSLFFGATQQAAGTWGATGSGAANIDDTHFSGTGVVSVTSGIGGSAYTTWANSKGLTGANNGATQDPEFDGIANILEFILGGNPLASDTGKLPVLTTNATDFIYTFSRADESEAEITSKFQYGSTLAGWTDVAIGATTGTSGSEVIVAENGALPDTITVTIPRTSAVGGKLFGRLNAVK